MADLPMIRARSREAFTSDRLFRRIAAFSIAIAVVTLVVSQLFVQREPMIPGTLPRMQPPPANSTELLQSLGFGSVLWYMCLASAPLFIAIARRVPLERGRLVSSGLLTVSAIVGMSAVTALVQYRVSYHGSPLAPPLLAYLLVGLITGLLPFATVAAATHAIDARARATERALDTERVRAELAESRLEALSAQLQPHFLFNTLQGISTLINRDPVAADAMLADLSDLLREVLTRRDRREIPLGEEIRILESYLGISQKRFGDRLSVRVDIDASTAQALVPFFILQPLVENALQHGIATRAGPGTVHITSKRLDDQLVLIVKDDGPGAIGSDSGRGIGIANTTARLNQLYGPQQSLTLARTANGFAATITLPFVTTHPAPRLDQAT